MSKCLGLIVILVIVISLLLPISVVAQPNVCGFYGSVTLDGTNVGSGTVVKAWIDSAVVKTVTASGSGYSMYVAGNYLGKTVVFTVGTSDVTATQSSLWEAGANKRLNLTAVTSSTPPPVTTPPATTPPVTMPSVEAGITLVPTEGALTTVSGVGFNPLSEIKFTWQGKEVGSIPARVTADNTGEFAALILAPSLIEGDYVIGAFDGVHSAMATFTMISLKGASGDIGPAGLSGSDGKDGSAVLGIIAIVLALISIVLVSLMLFSILKPKASEIE